MLLLIMLLLVFALLTALTNGFVLQRIPLASNLALLSSKREIADEQYRIQQDILARRKDKTKMKDYFESVEQRRDVTASKIKETIWTGSGATKNADPLSAWKQARSDGKIKKLGYEDQTPDRSTYKFFSFPMPASPIDIPKYDEGQRFDLRLPYAERGYEDPDSDIMGKIGGFFAGLGKKKAPAAEDPSKKDGKAKK